MSEVENKIDLVWGGEEIAKLIGRTPRITFHLLEKGELPAKKVGNRWVAERGQLMRFFLGGVA
ncbi:DNA-binding protein [Sinorhizobium meliloti]|uniref:DNA-binding protein n=1 Tax=Rhizobium meliloti TaxID=382 RepID=UPI00299D9910|nr:DNA-binding protein [Sinorhizobium meliloti]MDW9872253.1 DNA-binding protein [Sinorhizobium meliloti]MDW9885439.1 DNA-binding protein [Sinorhizobium meliloti]MDX0207278.1 DNA-binding protein [Sinorhizobium meliloti]